MVVRGPCLSQVLSDLVDAGERFGALIQVCGGAAWLAPLPCHVLVGDGTALVIVNRA